MVLCTVRVCFRRVRVECESSVSRVSCWVLALGLLGSCLRCSPLGKDPPAEKRSSHEWRRVRPRRDALAGAGRVYAYATCGRRGQIGCWAGQLEAAATRTPTGSGYCPTRVRTCRVASLLQRINHLFFNLTHVLRLTLHLRTPRSRHSLRTGVKSGRHKKRGEPSAYGLDARMSTCVWRRRRPLTCATTVILVACLACRRWMCH